MKRTILILALLFTGLAYACDGAIACRPRILQPQEAEFRSAPACLDAAVPKKAELPNKSEKSLDKAAAHWLVIGMVGILFVLRKRRASMWMIGSAVGVLFAALGYVWVC